MQIIYTGNNKILMIIERSTVENLVVFCKYNSKPSCALINVEIGDNLKILNVYFFFDTLQ